VRKRKKDKLLYFFIKDACHIQGENV